MKRISLKWKILSLTSAGLVALLSVVGWLVQRNSMRTAETLLENEVRAGFEAYRSLWQARADRLASISRVLSGMADVRAAFGTGDAATIRDTAAEIWKRVSDERAVFVVVEPSGRPIASLGGPLGSVERELPVIAVAARQFPKQATGFLWQAGRLYQVVITPVYVDSVEGQSLLNVLLAGYEVDARVARQLEEATGGSEFVFADLSGRVVAASVDEFEAERLARQKLEGSAVRRISDGRAAYSVLATPLNDIEGRPVAELRVLRSFAAAERLIGDLRRNILWICVVALAVGLGLTWLLAQRILQPVEVLDRAAAEIGRQNYGYQVEVIGEDELARLGRTFNSMSESIRNSREELIRHERIATIGRVAASIVHDLRNPLAAIYGGAEMLVDGSLNEERVRRVASNIYRASQSIHQMLQELAQVSRGRTEPAEVCRLLDVVQAAVEPHQAQADTQGVQIRVEVPPTMELSLERHRMERVFQNLVSNALEAMRDGGELHIQAVLLPGQGKVRVEVEDSGIGVPETVRERLFQPFVTEGKKNGLGLGLALARQTVKEHGGEMTLETGELKGAKFVLILPLQGAQQGVRGGNKLAAAAR